MELDGWSKCVCRISLLLSFPSITFFHFPSLASFSFSLSHSSSSVLALKFFEPHWRCPQVSLKKVLFTIKCLCFPKKKNRNLCHNVFLILSERKRKGKNTRSKKRKSERKMKTRSLIFCAKQWVGSRPLTVFHFFRFLSPSFYSRILLFFDFFSRFTWNLWNFLLFYMTKRMRRKKKQQPKSRHDMIEERRRGERNKNKRKKNTRLTM